MFQTEIIHAIQWFSSDLLTSIISLISSTGDHWFLFVTLIIIVFGINFRKGIFIAQTVLWAIVLTQLLKEYFSLPRPYHVDSSIKLFDSNIQNQYAFKNMGAKNFFGKLPDEVVNYYRSCKNLSYGFPSGHCSSIMSLLGSIIALFKKKWLTLLSIIFIILVTFSRLYLGHHFLLDVLGGLILGILILFINYLFMKKGELINKSDLNKKYVLNYFNVIYMIVPPLFLLLITQSIYAAQIFGLNLGFVLLIRLDNIPSEEGTILQRILRICIASIIFIILSFFISFVFESLFQREIKVLRIIRQIITYLVMVWGSTRLFLIMGLYKKETNS
jgi:membrane-associated phospholipid phosphatase